MPDLRIPSSSVQMIRQKVNTTEDPTSLLVSMAVMPRGEEPEAADFKTASWLEEGGTYYAQVLIGVASPGIGVLTEGIYKSWVKVTVTPEVPVLESPNYLVIT